jgi:hypothetical protein
LEAAGLCDIAIFVDHFWLYTEKDNPQQTFARSGLHNELSLVTVTNGVKCLLKSQTGLGVLPTQPSAFQNQSSFP